MPPYGNVVSAAEHTVGMPSLFPRAQDPGRPRGAQAARVGNRGIYGSEAFPARPRGRGRPSARSGSRRGPAPPPRFSTWRCWCTTRTSPRAARREVGVRLTELQPLLNPVPTSSPCTCHSRMRPRTCWGAGELALMKARPFASSTVARGGIVNEADLLAAPGVGVTWPERRWTVWSEEPPVSPLLQAAGPASACGGDAATWGANTAGRRRSTWPWTSRGKLVAFRDGRGSSRHAVKRAGGRPRGSMAEIRPFVALAEILGRFLPPAREGQCSRSVEVGRGRGHVARRDPELIGSRGC